MGNKAPIGDKWTPPCEAIFTELKKEVLSAPILARPDFNRRFYLQNRQVFLGHGSGTLAGSGER